MKIQYASDLHLELRDNMNHIKNRYIFGETRESGLLGTMLKSIVTEGWNAVLVEPPFMKEVTTRKSMAKTV